MFAFTASARMPCGNTLVFFKTLPSVQGTFANYTNITT